MIKINNHTQDYFEAYFRDPVFEGSGFTRNTKFINGSSIIPLSNQVNSNPITLSGYIGGDTPDIALDNISKLINESKECTIENTELHIKYGSSIQMGKTFTHTGVGNYYEFTLNFDCIPMALSPISQSLVLGDNPILIKGCQEVPLIITLQNQGAETLIVSLDNNIITLNNLESNKVYIVDGKLGKVTCEGINYFGSTKLYKFPSFTPGGHNINLVGLTTNDVITVAYTPIII